MAILANRLLQITLSGDVTAFIPKAANDNAASPGQIQQVQLSIGNNTIAAPVITGVTVTALTIIPPAGNGTLITLKGTGTDSGIPLSKLDPTHIPLDTTFVSLVLNVGVQINDVTIIWT